MNTTRHTPGPWERGKVATHAVYIVQDGGERTQLATCIGDEPFGWDTADANARLIAAAPELLEACEAALEIVSIEFERARQAEDFCKGAVLGKVEETIGAAIAKARGEQS